MATYVLSDIHGRLATFDRMLEQLAFGDDDQLFVLGDMVDRGSDPVGVLRHIRALPNARVLRGNHEELMLDALNHPNDALAQDNWARNGGISTALGLSSCADEERIELIDWISSLPTYAYTFIDGRPYLFAHAGIRPGVGRVPSLWDEKGCEFYLASQSSEDLIWIREDFWSRPTGLIVQDGTGPVVIAGHTPVVFAEKLCDLPNNAAINEEGFAQILYCGRCEATGFVADRIDIDCCGAAGAGFGRLGTLRLDDGAEFYEAVRDGE